MFPAGDGKPIGSGFGIEGAELKQCGGHHAAKALLKSGQKQRHGYKASFMAEHFGRR